MADLISTSVQNAGGLIRLVNISPGIADTDGGTVGQMNTRLPTGVIVMWSGSIIAIPGGWVICNGANGTPDLRDRFIVGAGTTYAVAATGGEANHTLVAGEIPAHTHIQDPHTHVQNSHTHPSIQVQGGTTAATTGTHIMTSTAVGGSSRAAITPELANAATAVNQNATPTNQNTGGGGAHENRPPYYALAYIMKT